MDAAIWFFAGVFVGEMTGMIILAVVSASRDD